MFGANFSHKGEVITVRKLDNDIVQALTGLSPDQAAAIMMDEYHGRGLLFAEKLLQDICSKSILAVLQFRHTICCRSDNPMACRIWRTNIIWTLAKVVQVTFTNYMRIVRQVFLILAGAVSCIHGVKMLQCYNCI